VVIDNGRAINTFTPDVAQNLDVFNQGLHYGIPGRGLHSSTFQLSLSRFGHTFPCPPV
jgi:hypothetical protein